MPWNSFSRSALAHNPPSDMVRTDGGIEFVPLPRARPKQTATSRKAVKSARKSRPRRAAKSRKTR
jgi:hypothetical protein